MKDKELMRAVQMAQFSVIETNLYLDTHPCDTEALDALAYYGEKLVNAIEKYEEECGPLYAASDDTAPYSWVKTPFPWELEC